jgi:dihydroorotate dehydrogenase
LIICAVKHGIGAGAALICWFLYPDPALSANPRRILIIDRFDLSRPILRLLPPELANAAAIQAMALRLAGKGPLSDDPILAIRRFGLDFSNPVGLAAGFDKNAEIPYAALRLGFGFTEFGTVTPRPQPGNPKPRVFRIPRQRAVINRLGFNNRGLDAAVARMEKLRSGPRAPRGWIGGNIGRNKDAVDAVADYALAAARLSPLVDYLTVNVSSPNTPGLRALQGRAALTELLLAVLAARQRPTPVLVKIAPDLTEDDLADVIRAVTDAGIAGIIVSNTTVTRPPGLPPAIAREAGGLSGPPLFTLATDMLRRAYRMSGGVIPLIGVGGIGSADDAYVKIRAGASLVQLYTALIYEGPGLVGRIVDGLAARLHADGFRCLEDAVGADSR